MKRTRSVHQKSDNQTAYQILEPRQMLAAYFPTYINGEFTLGNGPSEAAPYALEDTFNLSSNPESTKTIYLDFTGHHSVNNDWGHDIRFPAFDRDGDPSTFSDAELIEIQLQFQNVAEDMIPFDINVTTVEPDIEKLRKTSPDDVEFGVRAVNTQATDGFGGFGGVAFLNSWNDPIDNPVFTLNKGENNGAMTNSHEVGHAFGLRHDGLGGQQYHPGADNWGPIMGAPFGETVTQWSVGDYSDSTNTEDDFEIITKEANDIQFREDEAGDTIETAIKLEATGDDVFDFGVIEVNTDMDFYSFQKGDGNVFLQVNAFDLRPNLDILATIYDSEGNVVAQDNPQSNVNAFFDLALPAGEYFLGVEGTGRDGVYSDYGSVGFYTIEGVIDNLIVGLPIGESGHLPQVNHEWQTVQLIETYNDPVIIASPVSMVGGDPSTVRIRNVTSNSFEIRIQEWDYRDGRHTYEALDYLVVDSGEYVLDDGTILFAKNEVEQTQRWKTYGLGDTFRDAAQDPIVFAQVVTNNDPAAVTTRVRKVTPTEFQIKIQEEQANVRTQHGAETVSWLAIQQNMDTLGDLNYETGETPNAVTHRNYNLDFNRTFNSRPAFFAEMQTFDGGDPAAIRVREVTPDGARFFLQEERSLDFEVRHNPEVVGYWAIDTGLIVGRPNESPIASKTISAESQRLWDAYHEMRSWGEDTMPLGHQHGDDDGNGHGPGCGCAGCCSSGEVTLSSSMQMLVNFVETDTSEFADRFETTVDFQQAQTEYLDELAGSINWKQTVLDFSNGVESTDSYFEQIAEELDLDFELFI